jgi:hypothetical protein
MNRSLLATAFALPLLAGVGLALSDHRHESEEDDHEYAEHQRPDFAPADHSGYLQECGACHLAYPPGLLPARSWGRIMDGLGDHFGDNAELAAAEAEPIRAYLQAQAADRGARGRARSVAASLGPEQTPLRIAATPWFRRQHHEIPPALVAGNPQVAGFGNCQACHRGAEDGSFDEHQVSIPGYPYWDD